MMKKFLTLISLAVFLALSINMQPVGASDYAKTNIIDDAVFTNESSMSEVQIQAFINQFPNSCLQSQNYPSGLSPATFKNPIDYWTYDTSDSSPAHIIYWASTYYHLNPQVILTTLEKEENLVTGSQGCSLGRYNSAMGYNCPDSLTYHTYANISIYNTCVERESNASFVRQVSHATWQLRFDEERAYGNVDWGGDGNVVYGGRMTQGYRARVYGGTPIYYDGYTVIDGESIFLNNGSTAALYNYTPHFSNFYNIFTNWFGSTHGAQEGQLVKSSSSSSIYLIENGTKRPFPSAAVLFSYSWDWSDILTISDMELNSIPNGSVMPLFNVNNRNGQLIGTGVLGGVYLIENGVKRAFPSADIFLSYSHDWSDVVPISNKEFGLIPQGSDMSAFNVHYRDGQLIKTAASSGAYKVESGAKRAIPSGLIFSSYSYKWADIVTISDVEFGLIPDGANLDYNVHYRDGQLIKTAASSGAYKVENGAKRAIPSGLIFSSYSYKWADIVTISDVEFGLIPDGANLDLYQKT